MDLEAGNSRTRDIVQAEDLYSLMLETSRLSAS